jgi:hypothetical protein
MSGSPAIAIAKPSKNAVLRPPRPARALPIVTVVSPPDSRTAGGLTRKSVESARTGDARHDDTEFAALTFDRVAEDQWREAKASEGAAMTQTVFCAGNVNKR